MNLIHLQDNGYTNIQSWEVFEISMKNTTKIVYKYSVLSGFLWDKMGYCGEKTFECAAETKF
jgi:hypothetical protein